LSKNRKDTRLFDGARDELFSHINRCGVLRATPEQQTEWMDDTIEYMAERYPELAREELDELRAIGLRFCQPAPRRAPAASNAPTENPSEGADSAAA